MCDTQCCEYEMEIPYGCKGYGCRCCAPSECPIQTLGSGPYTVLLCFVLMLSWVRVLWCDTSSVFGIGILCCGVVWWWVDVVVLYCEYLKCD